MGLNHTLNRLETKTAQINATGTPREHSPLECVQELVQTTDIRLCRKILVIINDILKNNDNVMMRQEHEGYEWNHEGRRRKRQSYHNAFRGDLHELEAKVAIAAWKALSNISYIMRLEKRWVEDDKRSMGSRQEVIDRPRRRKWHRPPVEWFHSVWVLGGYDAIPWQGCYNKTMRIRETNDIHQRIMTNLRWWQRR